MPIRCWNFMHIMTSGIVSVYLVYLFVSAGWCSRMLLVKFLVFLPTAKLSVLRSLALSLVYQVQQCCPASVPWCYQPHILKHTNFSQLKRMTPTRSHSFPIGKCPWQKKTASKPYIQSNRLPSRSSYYKKICRKPKAREVAVKQYNNQ